MAGWNESVWRTEGNHMMKMYYLSPIIQKQILATITMTEVATTKLLISRTITIRFNSS